MRRPLGSAARQDGAPAARRGGGGSEPHPEQAANHIAAGPEHNVRSRTRPAPPRRGPGPGRRRSGGDVQRFDGSRTDLTY